MSKDTTGTGKNSKNKAIDNINQDNNANAKNTNKSGANKANYRYNGNQTIRKAFGKYKGIEIDDLISIQHESYDQFLQLGLSPKKRKNIGLQRVFTSLFPIQSYNKQVVLEFVEYITHEPRHDIEECKKGDLTYAVPVQIKLKRSVYQTDEETKEKKLIDMVEQDVHLGAIPLMTPQGSFVISGVERVLVSQLHRAPGAFFEDDQGKNNTSGKSIYSARIIPSRGSWLDFEFDIKDNLFVRIDKKKKVLASTLLMCLDSANHNVDKSDSAKLARSGMSKTEILGLFYKVNNAVKTDGGWVIDWIPSEWTGTRLSQDLIDGKTRKVLLAEGNRVNQRVIKEFEKQGVKSIFIDDFQFIGSYLAADIINADTGVIIANAGDELTYDTLDRLHSMGLQHFHVLSMNRYMPEVYWRHTVIADQTRTREEALTTIYRIFRPGEHPSVQNAWNLLQGLFFDPERYTLSDVGRVRLNLRLKLDTPLDTHTLTNSDICEIVRTLLEVKAGREKVDDVDGLMNRRVRSAGELLENHCYAVLSKIRRLITERMSALDWTQATPFSLFNSQLFISSVKEFFTKSQLSQFMDHTNPLSMLTHLRRLSCLGQGGLSRNHAGTEVRDTHPTYYSKICPVQTPDGANIGLINALTVSVNIDQYGFLRGRYRKVENKKITDEIVYLSAIEEMNYNIAHADTERDDRNHIIGSLVQCRKGVDSVMIPPEEVQYIDSTTNQIVSIATSLIPGLENTDATRDLMGANMSGQAVPGIFTESPIVGTGMEKIALRNTKTSVYAKRSGVVAQVDADRIVIKADEYNEEEGLVDIYRLKKYQQSNAGTCINEVPVVHVGDYVSEGDVIADGPSASKGELSLGYNVNVAFLSFEGRNFEDSIVISEKLAQNDVFKSIHIQTFELSARDTRNGQQEITADIPDIGKEKLWHLDEAGIVQVGTEVHPGMILIGRVTPKVETPISGEDKLMRAIFRSASSAVKDDSLYVPAGVTGTVVDVKVFTRKGAYLDEKAVATQQMEMLMLQKDRDTELDMLNVNFSHVIKSLIVGHEIESGLNLTAGTKLTDQQTRKITMHNVKNIKMKDKELQKRIGFIMTQYDKAGKNVQDKFKISVEKLESGMDLPPGVIKIVKVYIAAKRSIQEGDKLAGRHGNKGVISYVLPVEDMPYTADGNPIDMVLSPLGVVSRMNLGQILEIHLGLASKGLTDKLQNMLLGLTSEQAAKDALEQSAKTEELAEGLTLDIDHKKLDIENTTPSDLRKFLKDIYSHESDYVDSLTDDEIVDWSIKLSQDGVKFACPVFDGAREDDVRDLLKKAGMPESGQLTLYDGRTGKAFDSPVTVGSMYMLKLHHLVEDKMHARSIGPYSSVTLQPLGGKAQDGGQRDGEMENWAFQAYGAAYILLEMMTLKSDDVIGRMEAFAAMTQGRPVNQVSVPVVLQVFMKELEALCLKVNMISRTMPLRDGWYRTKDIEKISITLSSPEDILARSYGEPTKPETINYRNAKPERDGLCCQRIFGPVRDYECACGKYRKMKYRGIVCEKCGVEVTTSWTRRERMGHITLAAPVLHTWFYRILPSRVSLTLNMGMQDIEAILNYDRYVVIDPGMTLMHKGQLLTEGEYQEAVGVEGAESFIAAIGATAIEMLLKSLDIEKELEALQAELSGTAVKSKRKKLIARFKLLDGFRKANIKPEWMILRVIPVLPAELRPLVAIEGGRFASSDLNELYRRLINRNNRLKRLIELRAPEILIRNEKRLLQESVDNLFDNSRRDRPVLGANKRPLRSLSDMLKGKQGRFRTNLLGKRVDYSGRSVIAVDSKYIRLHQCGLPRMMALELFKPFVYARLIRDGITLTLRDARRMVEEERPEAWDALEEVVYRHPVLLNRAPTLHRLGIRAFEPVLIDGKAIRLHPLVCSGFNADFDGDQMAVHVPLSIEAQLEARILMFGTNNLLSPANGKPAILPSKDMVLGVAYLTYMNDQLGDFENPRKFYSIRDASQAFEDDEVKLHEKIQVIHDDKWHDTTPGRIKLFEIMPSHDAVKFELINQDVKNKQMSTLFSYLYEHCGQNYVGDFADNVMRLGFEYATTSGISFSLMDLHIPEAKHELVSETNKRVEKLHEQYLEGLITENERYNKVQDLWIKCIDKLSTMVIEGMSEKKGTGLHNPIYTMIDSGARGTRQQLMHMIGMRGLVVKSGGEVLEHPVKQCYKEGLHMGPFFYTIHGVRKGVADTALKTAVAGYLTRRLVDVAQDLVVRAEDCGTEDGLLKKAVIQGDTTIVNLTDRVMGRVTQGNILNPVTGDILVKSGTLVDKQVAKVINEHNVQEIFIRSPLTCKTHDGVCVKCYGKDLGRDRMVSFGTAVGVIAAQSISEPGTQLTMRTFHSGGGAAKNVEASIVSSPVDGTAKVINARTIKNKQGVYVVVGKGAKIIITNTKQQEVGQYEIPYGTNLLIRDGEVIQKDQKLAEWDPYMIPIIADSQGIAHYRDLIDGISLRADEEEVDEGISAVVIDWRRAAHGKDLRPSIQLLHGDKSPIVTEYGAELRYYFDVNTRLLVKDGQMIYPGDVIAQYSRSQLKSGDITGGLPTVSELFEARKPKDAAMIAEIDGIVRFTKDYRAHRRLILEPLNPDVDVPREYVLASNAHLLVQEGHTVTKGEMLTDGRLYSADLLRVLGFKPMTEYFINAVQSVYRAQGITIDEKHIEMIIKPMLQTVEITDPGESTYLIGERVDGVEFEENNTQLALKGLKPAHAIPYLQGISDRSLGKSGLAAAAFQDSIKRMLDAACQGQVDDVKKRVKTAMMTANLPELGTGAYVYSMHEQIEALNANKHALKDEIVPEDDLVIAEDLQLPERL